MGQGYTYIGNRATKLDVSQSMLPVGRIILTDDSGNGYSAQVANFSESTHSTLTKDDEFASQARANAILQELQGYVYKPYQATDAVVDPLAEAGDSVQVGDVYGYVDGLDYTCDALGTSDVGASNNSEEQSESQFESIDTLKQKRMSKRVDSVEAASGEATAAIQVLSNAIELEATARSNEDTALSGRITVNANNISSKVSKGSVISEINQSAEAVTINANKVNLNGYVTMTNLATAGQTSVNGSNIQSGTITLGGNGNGNGQMRIVDTNNVEIGTWTNTGIRILDDTSDIQTQLYSKFKICRAGDDSDGCFIGCGQPYNSAHPGTFPNESVPTLLLIGKEDSSIRGSISLVPILGCTFDRTSIEFTNGSELFGVNSGGTNEAIGWDSTGMYYQRIDSGGITKKYFKNLTGW